MAQKKNSPAPDYSGQQFNNVTRQPALPGSFSNSSGGWGGPGDMQQSYDARVQRLRDQTPEQLTQQANQFQQRQQHNARTPEQRGQVFDRNWNQAQGDYLLDYNNQMQQQNQADYLPELGTGNLPHEQQGQQGPSRPPPQFIGQAGQGQAQANPEYEVWQKQQQQRTGGGGWMTPQEKMMTPEQRGMMGAAQQRRDFSANKKLPLSQQKMPPGGSFIDPSQQVT